MHSETCNYFFIRFINSVNVSTIGFRCLMWGQRDNSLFSFLHRLTLFLSFLTFQVVTCMNYLIMDLNTWFFNIRLSNIKWNCWIFKIKLLDCVTVDINRKITWIVLCSIWLFKKTFTILQNGSSFSSFLSVNGLMIVF